MTKCRKFYGEGRALHWPPPSPAPMRPRFWTPSITNFWLCHCLLLLRRDGVRQCKLSTSALNNSLFIRLLTVRVRQVTWCNNPACTLSLTGGNRPLGGCQLKAPSCVCSTALRQYSRPTHAPWVLGLVWVTSSPWQEGWFVSCHTFSLSKSSEDIPYT